MAGVAIHIAPLRGAPVGRVRGVTGTLKPRLIPALTLEAAIARPLARDHRQAGQADEQCGRVDARTSRIAGCPLPDGNC